MSTYHFIAASEAFLTVEEPLAEVLRERERHYGEQGKAIDFWLVRRPRFLEAPELAGLAAAVPRPCRRIGVAACVETCSRNARIAPRRPSPHSSSGSIGPADEGATTGSCAAAMKRSCQWGGSARLNDRSSKASRGWPAAIMSWFTSRDASPTWQGMQLRTRDPASARSR